MTAKPDQATWDVQLRPHLTPYVAYAAAFVLVAAHVVIGLLLKIGSTGVIFQTSDQIAMAGLGLVLAGLVLLFARPRLRVGAAGLSVRNVLSDRLVPWDDVVGVSFPVGARWARIDLPDDEYIPLMAIQSVDKDRAVAAMDTVRSLLARYRPDLPSTYLSDRRVDGYPHRLILTWAVSEDPVVSNTCSKSGMPRVRRRSRPRCSTGSARRVEPSLQAAARRLVAVGELFVLRLRDSGEQADCAMDTWDAVAAQVAASLRCSIAMGSSYLRYAMALRERLPEVGRLFQAGDIDYRSFQTIVFRTDLITDAEALARVDALLAMRLSRYPSLTRGRLAAEVDRAVAKADRDAVRRAKEALRDRYVDVDHGRTHGVCDRKRAGHRRTCPRPSAE